MRFHSGNATAQENRTPLFSEAFSFLYTHWEGGTTFLRHVPGQDSDEAKTKVVDLITDGLARFDAQAGGTGNATAFIKVQVKFGLIDHFRIQSGGTVWVGRRLGEAKRDRERLTQEFGRSVTATEYKKRHGELQTQRAYGDGPNIVIVPFETPIGDDEEKTAENPAVHRDSKLEADAAEEEALLQIDRRHLAGLQGRDALVEAARLGIFSLPGFHIAPHHQTVKGYRYVRDEFRSDRKRKFASGKRGWDYITISKNDSPESLWEKWERKTGQKRPK